MTYGIADIMKAIPHRFPMLLIDKMVEIEANKRGVGLKCVTYNEAFFQGHFLDYPIMPGALIIECMAQVTAIILSQPRKESENIIRNPVYLVGVDKVKFKKPVIPGDTMYIGVEVLKKFGTMVKVKSEIKVLENVVASGEITVGG